MVYSIAYVEAVPRVMRDDEFCSISVIMAVYATNSTFLLIYRVFQGKLAALGCRVISLMEFPRSDWFFLRHPLLASGKSRNGR